jgi:hypothetical protein
MKRTLLSMILFTLTGAALVPACIPAAEDEAAPDGEDPGQSSAAATVWPPPPNGNPRTAVYDWKDVRQWSCKVAAGRRKKPAVTDGKEVAKLPVHACAKDADCQAGEKCDSTSGCKCCVPDDIPEVKEPNNRYVPTVCEDKTGGGKRCKLPFKCTRTDDTHCKMAPGGRVWASTYPTDPATQPTLASALKQLCIKVEPDYDTPPYECLWKTSFKKGDVEWDVRTGTNVSAPDNPPDGYECGGRTCNGSANFLGKQLKEVVYEVVYDNCNPPKKDGGAQR